MQDPLFEARARHWLAEHGFDHPKRLPASAGDPLEVARVALTEQIRAGRTVTEWVAFGKAENLLSLRPDAPRAPADLAAEVERLNAAAGFPLDAAQRADVRAQAEALPADVREPFAALVAATADAYEAQAPIAAGVVARVPASARSLEYVLTNAEREATLANAVALLAAQNAFRDAVRDVAFPASGGPLFRDPNGLVILGSTGADTYARDGVLRDAALLVDPAGDDVHATAAGGACADPASLVHDCNGLVVSLVVDLRGNDEYLYDGVPTNAQGSASLGAIGLLVDVEGDDRYLSNFVQATTRRPFWGGVIGYIDAGVQGYALAGVGILLDAVGDDTYEADVTTTRYSIWDFAQGFGNAGGVGIAADGLGNDRWLAYGFHSHMPNSGFQGMYPGGTGFFGGLGLLTDTGLGNDRYHAWDNATTTDFYAYGFGAFGGTGIFYEDGGDDDYQAVEEAFSPNPGIVPLLNCAFGTASFAGLGVFLELGGNDRYFGDTRSARAVATMNEGFGGPAEGEGIFIDVSGDDGHFMEGHVNGQLRYDMTHGRGNLFGGGEGFLGGNTVGVYLDLGGLDAYTGAAPSQNNAAWLMGLDLEAGRIPRFLMP
ncbi:MAG TPA: hypothetical protein VFH78_12845 [Candidatus Thermoplasmatota archaeon]|nr:hypothetical protein [Candidatus Thermoplasmatota archaeon]